MAVSPNSHTLPRAGAAAQPAPLAPPAVPAGRPDLPLGPMSFVALLTNPGTFADARCRPPL